MRVIALCLLNLFLLNHASANAVYRDSAEADEKYLKKMEKEETSRQEMRENPRNPAMVESFEQVRTQEERKLEKEKKKKGR